MGHAMGLFRSLKRTYLLQPLYIDHHNDYMVKADLDFVKKEGY